jgi:putative FmdB family regulatory protein
MPLYKFKCKSCGTVTEKLTKIGKEVIWCEREGCGQIADRIFCADGGSFRKGEGYWADGKSN